MEELIDFIDGVEVNNRFSFTYNGKIFPIGKQLLNGYEATNFVRMYYVDPRADFGWQEK